MIGAVTAGIPDKIGRKPSMMLAMFVDLTTETVMLWVPNYYVRMGGFFVLGLTQMKSSIPYAWLTESIAPSYKSTGVTILNCFDALPQTLMCLYIVFISQNAFELLFWSLIVGYSVFIMFFFFVESPFWLLIHG